MKCFLCGDPCTEMTSLEGGVDVCSDCGEFAETPFEEEAPVSELYELGSEFDDADPYSDS